MEWPSHDKMKGSTALVEGNRGNGPLLRNVLAVVDVGGLACTDYIDENEHNAFCEVYTKCVETINLFVYNFKGEIIHVAVNYPGRWHNSQLATLSKMLYLKLRDETTSPGMAILRDSTFVVVGRVSGGTVVSDRRAMRIWDAWKSQRWLPSTRFYSV